MAIKQPPSQLGGEVPSSLRSRDLNLGERAKGKETKRKKKRKKRGRQKKKKREEEKKKGEM